MNIIKAPDSSPGLFEKDRLVYKKFDISATRFLKAFSRVCRSCQYSG